MLLNLQSGIIYGPVQSRRLGCSLGINLLPTHQKICSFNCLYCQYGLEESQASQNIEKKIFPSPKEIVNALKLALKRIKPLPAYITFSGNGEATLHPNFPEIAFEVRKAKNRLAPSAKTAILSNSTTVSLSNIREALALIDVPIMKLDAGTQEMFTLFNQPEKRITLKNTVAGLKALNNITIQSLFCKGLHGNYSLEHLKNWAEQIKDISPQSVQLYTLDRESPTISLIPLEKEELEHIRIQLEKENIIVKIF